MKAAENADAIIILTEWDIYFEIEWSKVAKVMRNPAWVFDTRSIIQKEKIKNTSLRLWKIGDGSISN